jgi:hypothetical protein
MKQNTEQWMPLNYQETVSNIDGYPTIIRFSALIHIDFYYPVSVPIPHQGRGFAVDVCDLSNCFPVAQSSHTNNFIRRFFYSLVISLIQIKAARRGGG